MSSTYRANYLKFRWILAKYEVDTFKDIFDMADAKKKYPEIKEYDFDFDEKQHKKELEVLR